MMLNDAQHNDAQHNEVQHNDTQLNDVQHNNTQHIEKNCCTHHNEMLTTVILSASFLFLC